MKKLLTLFICLLFGLGIMTSCRGKSPTKMVKEAEKLIEGTSKSASKTLPAREIKTPPIADDVARYVSYDDEDDDYAYTEEEEGNDDEQGYFYVDDDGTMLYVDEYGCLYIVDEFGNLISVDEDDV